MPRKPRRKPLSSIVQRRMAELRLTQKEVCRRTGFSRLFVCHIRDGLAFPTGEKLERLAEALQLDERKLRKIAIENANGGALASTIARQNRSLQPLEEVWDELTERQREDLSSFARSLARRNLQSVPSARLPYSKPGRKPRR